MWKACFPADRPREADFPVGRGAGPVEIPPPKLRGLEGDPAGIHSMPGPRRHRDFHGRGPALHRTIRARAWPAPLPQCRLWAEGGSGGDFGPADYARRLLFTAWGPVMGVAMPTPVIPTLSLVQKALKREPPTFKRQGFAGQHPLGRAQEARHGLCPRPCWMQAGIATTPLSPLRGAPVVGWCAHL